MCQNSYKEVSATKSRRLTAADIVTYKDPSTHQMLTIAQSTSLAASSSMNNPPRPTFVYNSCNFSSCPITLLEMLIRVQKKDDYVDSLLEGVSIEQSFDC